MADDKRSGSAPEGGAGNSDKGGRRRYFWRKKRGQKPEGGDAEQPREQTPKEQAPKAQANSQRRSTPKAANPNNNNNNEKGDRDPRNKRRRRRPRSRQDILPEPKVIAPVNPIEDNYVAPKSVFIYTHVVRPDQRDSYEFRADHFAKGGRRLEDFDIDLSIIFPEDNPNRLAEAKTDDRPLVPPVLFSNDDDY